MRSNAIDKYMKKLKKFFLAIALCGAVCAMSWALSPFLSDEQHSKQFLLLVLPVMIALAFAVPVGAVIYKRKINKNQKNNES